MKTLLLWDIDGTLLNSGGSGMRALRVALGRVFGIDGSLDDIDFAGRTDRWIFRQVFTKFGLPATDENFQRYFEGYFEALPAQLAQPGNRVLPGIRSILTRAAGLGLAQGLLTGNVRRGAELKLVHHGIWSYFAFGAFADDSENRDELGAFALERAIAHAGMQFPLDRVWVIGDTPHDIACGRCIGARTLAVASGKYSVADLAAHSPTAVLPSFEDEDSFIKLVLAHESHELLERGF